MKETKIGMKIEEETKSIKKMCEQLGKSIEYQFDKGIEQIDTEEMKEAIDMLKDMYSMKKDIVEACYYKQIMEAMDESEYGEDYDEYGPMEDRKGYDSYRYKTSGRFAPRSKGSYMPRRGYKEPDYRMTPDMYNEHSPEWYRDMDRTDGKMYYTEPTTMPIHRDMREGRNGMARKGYIEAKEMHKANTPEDKEAKKKELDKWMSEIGTDIKELVHDMTAEEKTVAKQKLTNLANSL